MILELKDYARLQTSGILVGVVFCFLYTVFNISSVQVSLRLGLLTSFKVLVNYQL